MEILKLDKEINYFSISAHQLFTPEVFFHKVYGVGNNSVVVKDEYSHQAVDFLKKNAKLVRFSDNLYRKGDNKREEEDSGGIFGDREREGSNYVFLYKDNLVFTRTNSQDKIKMIFEFPAGYPCIVPEFDQFILEVKKESKVSLLMKEYGDIAVQSIPLDFPKDFNIPLNYGDEFVEINDIIIDKLNNRNGGIYLLHGSPGCGKSFYIKYLSSVVDREFIFIPNNFINDLSSPDFVTLLMKHKNAVLIIEDAENAIRERESSNNPSLVSVLLNISDGILSSILNISIIVTHNAEEDYIDTALLRKGRLMFRYEFPPLKTEYADRLAKELGLTETIDKPMSLADIYNLSDNVGAKKEKSEKKMGFY
jgi:hypothetical protein